MPRTPGWRHLDEEPCQTINVDFDSSAPSQARHLLKEALEAWGRCSDQMISDAVLVMSELVANSLQHGEPLSDGTIEVSWCLNDDHLLISVNDHGDAVPLGPIQADEEALGGRGLHIVDYLCDNWKVDHDRGTRVTAELGLPD